MAHGHHHHHHHHGPAEGSDSGSRNIATAFALNTAFAVLEIIGGFYTNSMAILSDAVHDLGDSLSLGFAWYFERKSRKAGDDHYTYGYRRFSLLGAFINAMILLISSAFIIRESVVRLFQPETPDAHGMFVLAIIGVAVNGYALFRLRKGSSINERVVALHFVEDVLGWVAVLIGSIVMIFFDVPVLDPILSLLIAGYILYNVIRNLGDTFRILMQRKPETIDEKAIRERLLAIPGVKGLHDVRFWTMDGQYNIMTLHVVVGENQTVKQREEIKRRVKDELHQLDIAYTTVEIESEHHPC